MKLAAAVASVELGERRWGGGAARGMVSEWPPGGCGLIPITQAVSVLMPFTQ